MFQKNLGNCKKLVMPILNASLRGVAPINTKSHGLGNFEVERSGNDQIMPITSSRSIRLIGEWAMETLPIVNV